MERGRGVVTPMTISFIKNNWSFKVFSGETSVVLIAVETLDRARSFVRRIRPTFDARRTPALHTYACSQVRATGRLKNQVFLRNSNRRNVFENDERKRKVNGFFPSFR